MVNMGKFFRYSAWFLLVALLASCSLDGPGSIFVTEANISREQARLFMLATYLGAVVFIIVGAAFGYAIWRFRAKDEEDAKAIPEQVHGNTVLEISWTFLPLVLVIILAIPTVRLTLLQESEAQRTAAGELRVNVTGYQWWWKFEYPEYGITTANEVHIPEGRRVTFYLESGDVLHSFWVPHLAGKKDVIPTQENILWFIPDNAKSEPYYGQCAELCLGAHAYMRFRVKVDSQSDFDTWVSSFQQASLQKIAADPLVQQGQQAFLAKGCGGCHTVDGIAVGNPRYPNLTNYGLRYTVSGVKEHTAENLATWIRDPQIFKPGNYMPTLWYGHDGEEEQINAIVAFLQSLGKTAPAQASLNQ